jgi:hypothetical protein
MKTYIIEQFTSRNTSFDREIKKRNAISAENYARISSTLSEYPVIVKDGTGQDASFSKFENGERTEWSYPNGLI